MEENNYKENKIENDSSDICHTSFYCHRRLESESLLSKKNSFYFYLKPSNDEEFKIKIDKKTNTIIINVICFNRDFIKRLESHSNNSSYYISKIGIKQTNQKEYYYIDYSCHSLERYLGRKLKNIEEFVFFIKPRFDIKLNKIPKKLYYLCDKNDVENILQTGLILKKHRNEILNIERLYFGLTKSSVKKMKETFQINKENIYVILEIETSKIKDLEKENLTIREDREKITIGVYLLDNIPPDAITVLKENIKF